MSRADSASTATYCCPDCGADLRVVDERRYECPRCGRETTEADHILETAETVRAEGFDELADRLEAAADQAREETDA